MIHGLKLEFGVVGEKQHPLRRWKLAQLMCILEKILNVTLVFSGSEIIESGTGSYSVRHSLVFLLSRKPKPQLRPLVSVANVFILPVSFLLVYLLTVIVVFISVD